MNNLIAWVIILTVAMCAGGFVWLMWDAWKRPYGGGYYDISRHDETQQCQR